MQVLDLQWGNQVIGQFSVRQYTVNAYTAKEWNYFKLTKENKNNVGINGI